MVEKPSSHGPKPATKRTDAGSRIPASIREQSRNSPPATIMACDSATSHTSDRVSSGLVGGILVSDLDAAPVVHSPPTTHDYGHGPNPDVMPLAGSTPPRAGVWSGPAGQVDPPTHAAISSSFVGRGINEPRMPSGAPELYDPSYMSQMGIGAMRPPWALSNDAELSPIMRDMKAFDSVKLASPNTLPVDQIRESGDFQNIVGNLQPTSPVEPSTAMKGSADDLNAIERSLSEIEAIGATLESLVVQPPVSDAEAVSRHAALSVTGLDADRQHTLPSSDRNCTLVRPAGVLRSSPNNGAQDSINYDSNSPGSVRMKDDALGSPAEIFPKGPTTVNTATENNIASPHSDALDAQIDQMTEEASSADYSMDERSPQSPTDTADNYQFPSEETVLARARTVGSELFSRRDANFDDISDSGEDINAANTTAGSRSRQHSSTVPPGLKLAPSKSVPLKIPVPDTMLHFFHSSDIPPPKWAPLTQYFPGGRIADPGDPDYRFFDNAGRHQAPGPVSEGDAPNTTLPPGNSGDARGRAPIRPKEKKILSIYDFIDKICPAEGDKDEHIALHAESAEDFAKRYFIDGPDGLPMLNNPPTGDIPQAQIEDLWYPTSLVERFRIERVIRLLDLEISPATRAALFWILIERQSKCTRDLLRLLAQYPSPEPKDVEERLCAWGYLPETGREEEDDGTKELEQMDPKDSIKSDVVRETQQLLDALREAAGSEKKLKFLLPFIGKYKAHNTGFFSLMGSDKMVELVVELCNCLRAGEKASDLPGFDIQMGYWTFIHHLRPSLFIAKSGSLCDLEYLYVVTHRAKVHPDILSVVVRVMAPILENVLEYDNIPHRREIPQEVKTSLELTKDARIARYLEAQFRLSAREPAAPKQSRTEHQEGGLAREDDMKLVEHQLVMRARVQYMDEGIQGDLPIPPGEIYSPKPGRRKLLEAKTSIPRPSKESGKDRVGYKYTGESEGDDQSTVEPPKNGQRVTRKRAREISDNMHGPSKAKKQKGTAIVSTSVYPKKVVVSPKRKMIKAARKKVAKGTSVDDMDLSPSTRTNKGARSKRLSLAKLSRNLGDADSDTSGSESVATLASSSDGEQDQQHSGSLAVEELTHHAGFKDESSESDEDEEPRTKVSIQGGIKREHNEVSKHREVTKRGPGRVGRVPSPLQSLSQKDAPGPGWIVPHLHASNDEEPPRKAPIPGAKGLKKVEMGSATGEPKVSTPSLHPLPQLLRRSPRKHQPKIKYESYSSSSEDGTAKRIPAQRRVSTPSVPAVSQPLRRSPRKHQPKRMYESDSSSSDADDDSDNYRTPQNRQNVKRVKISPGAAKKDSGQSLAMGEKPLLLPPTLGTNAKPVAKPPAGVGGNRAAAAKKAAVTRAANHQAFVEKVKADLVAEEQRAADAGGYRPGAVTQAQVKRRMKREKNKMRAEAAQKKLDAVVAQREQSAEAKKIAAKEKHAAAAKKRAATIAAKKAAIREKGQVSQAKPRRSPGSFAEPKGSHSNKAKIKQEKGEAQERIAKARAELEAAELAFTAETGLDLYSEEQDDSAESEAGESPAAQESTANRSGDGIKIKIERSAAISRTNTEHNSSVKAPIRKQKVSEGKRSVAKEAAVESEAHAGSVQRHKSQRQASLKTNKGPSEGYESRAKLWKEDLMEEPGRVLKTMLDTTCPPTKQYTWMEGNGGNSQGAGEMSEAKTDYQSIEQRKRPKTKPKK